MSSSGEPDLRFKIDPSFFDKMLREATRPVIIQQPIFNAYDADAEEVRITVEEDKFIVEDRGPFAGMTLKSLVPFFTLATQVKEENRTSDHYRRPYKGSMGLGRFAPLQIYNNMYMETERDGERWSFAASFDGLTRMILDEVKPPLTPSEPKGINGTVLEYSGVRRGQKPLTAEEVRWTIRNHMGVSLMHTKGPFSIYLNGERIKLELPKRTLGTIVRPVSRTVDGVIDIGYKALDGHVEGHIELAKSRLEWPGIILSVKGNPIGRFQLAEILPDVPVDQNRVRGELDCDFLITGQFKSGVRKEGNEWKKFYEVIREEVDELVKESGKGEMNRERKAIEKVEKWTTALLDRFLRANSEWRVGARSGQGEKRAVIKEAHGPTKEIIMAGAELTEEKGGSRSEASESKASEEGEKQTSRTTQLDERLREKKDRGNSRDRMRSPKYGPIVRILPLNEDSPAEVNEAEEGFTIWVNSDYPVFKARKSEGERNIKRWVADVVAFEIGLYHHPNDAKKANEIRWEILKQVEEELA